MITAISEKEDESKLLINPQASLFPCEFEDDVEDNYSETASTASDRSSKSRRVVPQEVPNRSVKGLGFYFLFQIVKITLIFFLQGL